MPDLLTHTLSVYPLKRKFKKHISIILLGAVLPDLLSRIPGILFPYRSAIYWAQSALHTPLALFFLCFLASFFFDKEIRRKIFLYLIFGVSTHLFLDLFQKTLTTSYFWLFPFSFKSLSIPLIWPNDTILLIPFFLTLNLFLMLLLRKNRLTK